MKISQRRLLWSTILATHPLGMLASARWMSVCDAMAAASITTCMLRIVEHFEQRYAAHRGLNLTLGVREGIIKHSRDYSVSEHPELAPYFLDQRPPLEAQLIDLADEIAYLTADLDDGVESGLLEIGHICENV